MKTFVIFLVFLGVLLYGCKNSEQNNITDIESTETYHEYDENCKDVFDYMIDSVIYKQSIIFDTIFYWDLFTKELVSDVIFSINYRYSFFTTDDSISILNDYSVHKSDDIKQMINKKYHNRLVKIISTEQTEDVNDQNWKIYWEMPGSKTKFDTQYLFSQPMFNDEYNKCLLYIAEMQKSDSTTTLIGGLFIYLKKDENGWSKSGFIKVQ